MKLIKFNIKWDYDDDEIFRNYHPDGETTIIGKVTVKRGDKSLGRFKIVVGKNSFKAECLPGCITLPKCYDMIRDDVKRFAEAYMVGMFIKKNCYAIIDRKF